MKKTVFLITMITALAFVSCRTQKQVHAPAPPVVLNNADSVRVETTIETTYEPVDVALDLPQQSETNVTQNDSSHVETDLAFSDAWFENGVLHHSIKNKPGQLKGTAFTPHTTEKSNKDAVKIREVPVPEPYPVEVERELTLMEQIKLAAFWYLVGAVIVSIGFIFRKPFLMVLRKIIRL